VSMSSLAFDPARLLRPDIAALEAYVPIEPTDILAARYGLDPAQIHKLDANENPYGPSPQVRAALAADLHQYPDPEHREIRALLARYTGLDAEWFLVGNGSDELIDLLLRAVITPGDEIIDCVPTFGMYLFSGEVCGARVVPVPRQADFAVDVAAVAAAITPRTKVIFIASPNNPTGNLLSEAALRALLDLGPLVVVDEAYFEFTGGATFLPLVPQSTNPVVLRTFSKWAGLAGLRVGYGAFPAWLRANLWKIKPPYNVNVAAQIAVRATFADLDNVLATVRQIIAERERLLAGLRMVPYLAPFPSAANFIYCPLTRGDAAALWAKLAQQGIFVRHYQKPLLRNAIRISVGRPDDTDAVLAALHAYTP
jgi:histidinol-phosphate aminotransferase